MKKVTTELYQPELGHYFKTLNEEWLQRLFVIEPIDREALANPQTIIDHGGQIIFALTDEQVVGCVALKHHGDGVIELTKMAVTAKFQTHGIGSILMQ